MEKQYFRPLIEKMVWSYSRVKSYYDCPHRFLLRYLQGREEEPMWYSSFGSLVHDILAEFYEGKLSKDDLSMTFLYRFNKEVQGKPPKDDTVVKQMNATIEFLDNLIDLDMNILGVEEHLEFTIEGENFHGYIDLVAEKDGELYVIDHKSRSLKPRSKRGKPTKKDEELDEMLIQLYLYAEAVKEKYGKYPMYLCFNCFKNDEFIVEPFTQEGLENAKQWAVENIELIKISEHFYPDPQYFKCNNLCGVSEFCDFYQDIKEGRADW